MASTIDPRLLSEDFELVGAAISSFALVVVADASETVAEISDVSVLIVVGFSVHVGAVLVPDPSAVSAAAGLVSLVSAPAAVSASVV